jgi:hypothetical protein
MGMQYLKAIPAPDAIPPGWVVVHNNVRPARRLGVRGFRAWLAPPTDRLAPCDCGWATEVNRIRLLTDARADASYATNAIAIPSECGPAIAPVGRTLLPDRRRGGHHQAASASVVG